MMKLMRKILSAFSASILSLLCSPALAFAVTPGLSGTLVPINAPLGSIATGAVDVVNIPQFILNLLFLIGIIVSIAFLIYGGVRWVLSRGDKTAVDAARSHIVAAIVGLIIVVAAFVIVNIVFTLLGVANPLKGTFQLPTLTNPGPVQPATAP